MRKIMLAISAASLMAAVLLGPSLAQATCTQAIYAERSLTNGATTQILGRTSATSTIFWFGSTTNSNIADEIVAAVSNRNRVQIIGDAASCPTTGTFRSVGTVTSIIINP